MHKSITNSKQVTENSVSQTAISQSDTQVHSYFFTQIGRWQYLIELGIASVILGLVLSLAEAQSWSALSMALVLKHVLYINWVVLSFAVLVEILKKQLHAVSLLQALFSGFLLLQLIVLLTSVSLNILLYWGGHFTFQGFTVELMFNHVLLHLSYGVLLGTFCFRYLFLREQWIRQQHSELNARIHAMQARIHPHFLFNSLNNVVSLISLDPDKAETMLINLSRLFRASFKELKLVNLNEELELCRYYLEIEKIRLGDRLEVDWRFENEELFSTVKIPLLTLQPLVENSIFHGVEKNLTKSRISILIEVVHNKISIVVINPYNDEKNYLTQGHGIAVENVKQRLQAYFGGSVTFQSYSGEGIFTTIVQYHYK